MAASGSSSSSVDASSFTDENQSSNDGALKVSREGVESSSIMEQLRNSQHDNGEGKGIISRAGHFDELTDGKALNSNHFDELTGGEGKGIIIRRTGLFDELTGGEAESSHMASINNPQIKTGIHQSLSDTEVEMDGEFARDLECGCCYSEFH